MATSPVVQELNASSFINSTTNATSLSTSDVPLEDSQSDSKNANASMAGMLQVRYTGLIRSDIDPEVAKALGLNDTSPGVMVTGVIPGSPAEKAEIRGADTKRAVDGEIVRLGGDIIVGVDGNGSVTSEDESFVDYLQNEKFVGDNITLNILRDGKINEIDLTLTALPDFFWYIDTDEGIKIKYPSDWTVSDRNLKRNDIIKFFSPEFDSGSETATAAVFLKISPSSGISLDELAARENEGTQNTRVLEDRGTDLAGLQAYEIIYYEYDPDRTLKVKSIFTIEDDDIYRINYAADVSTFDDYLPMVEEMIQSFQFIER
jgi:hypothetical protein